MHIIFLNPQGNFDPADSYMAEHPDFGGQLIYIKELAMAMADLGHTADIVTRRMEDPDWPEFSAPVGTYPGHEDNVRIVRIDCGGPKFLRKEDLWPHLDEFVDNTIAFYGDNLPDFATGHYADGGYCAARLKSLAGIGYTFTGHSLGAQKLDKLGTNLENVNLMEERFRFSRRIDAERLAMTRAFRIITSTVQERREQYSHPLYEGAVDANDDNKFAVTPPGVNLRIFTTETGLDDDAIRERLDTRLAGAPGPYILVSSRLDEKKNIIGVVEAYAESQNLRDTASLVLCIRGLDDPFTQVDKLPEGERPVLKAILSVIDAGGFRERVRFLNIRSQLELAATYRILGQQGSVFALTSFYEPFGLAPIEAAACGLACAATKNGGPSEIFEDGSGVLVDPFDVPDMARGLALALESHAALSKAGRQRVLTKYTWHQTAEGYLSVIKDGVSMNHASGEPVASLDASGRILDYLKHR